MKKNVFISYCSGDISKVKALVRRIEKTDCLHPIVVEYGRHSMQYLADKVIDGFKMADYIVPILTNNSINTQYINQEIGYAKAKKIPIMPLIEQDVMYKLKGFVTSQNDLPYNFKGFPENPKRERQTFRECCDILLEDLVSKVSKIRLQKNNAIGLSDIFSGTWQNKFEFPDGNSGTEEFSIKENDRYYIGDHFMFKLDKISISQDKKKITFRKNGVNNGDSRTALNILNLKHPGEYFGDEEGNKVTYSKLR